MVIGKWATGQAVGEGLKLGFKNNNNNNNRTKIILCWADLFLFGLICCCNFIFGLLRILLGLFLVLFGFFLCYLGFFMLFGCLLRVVNTVILIDLSLLIFFSKMKMRI